MCGPHRRSAPLLPHTLRRIPQVVGIVATRAFSAWGKENVAKLFQYRKR